MREIKVRIDSLGRVVLPAKFRKSLGITTDSNVLMTLDENAVTITAPDPKCVVCNSINDVNDEIGICRKCIQRIVVYSEKLAD